MNELEALLFAFRDLDFEADGKRIKGKKLFISRDSFEYENGWGLQTAFEQIFISSDSDVIFSGTPESLPCSCTLVYKPQGRRNVLCEVRF